MTEADSPESAPTEQPHAAPPPQNPFVPRYREPWVNPAKRTSVIIGGLAAAVVLLALGFLLGLGVSGGGHGGGHGGVRRDFPAVMAPPAGYGAPHGWTGYRPRGQYRPPLPGRNAPTPAPSSSHS